jgi:4-diphosphocytidyl-2-C-methyl-D-erythritol kinase
MGAVEVRVRVPAKVNLFLAVRGVRDDGYHELATVLQTVSLYDELRARLLGTPWARQHPSARKLMRLSLEHDAGPAVPDGGENLVLRAARELLCELWVPADSDPAELDRAPRTELSLRKGIPVAAGMAGGSADAAATLLALNRLWAADCSPEALHAIAARLGADVPFCLAGGTALATGTGADTMRVLARGDFHWVVGTAQEGLPTPAVYGAFDELDLPPSTIEPDIVLQALRTGDAELLAGAMHNDLETAAMALRPELGDKLEVMYAAGALRALVSGSGPTVVALAPDQNSARDIAEAVGDHFADVEVASSPAGGPRISETALQPTG